MSPRPLVLRFLLPFTLVIALIVLVGGAVIYWAGEQQTRRQQVRDLDGLVPLVRQWVAEDPALAASTRRRLADAAQVLHTRVSLIDGSGKVVLDTAVDPARLDNHNNRPEVIQARRGARASSVRDSHSLGEQAVYVATLLDPSKPDGMVVRVSYPEHTWAALATPAWALLGGGVVASVLAVAVFWAVLQHQWITPTRRLAEAAERMAGGEWSRRVEPRGADELRAFSGRLNAVAAHAQRQLANLKHQRADLQSLVDTLPDPVLVADASGKLVLMNLAASRLLDLSRGRALGQGVVNAVSDEAVLQLFERVRSQPTTEVAAASARAEAANGDGAIVPGSPDAHRPTGDGSPAVTREIRLNRRGQWLTYQAVAQRTADQGVLLVLRDVTALAATVQMKTDFVANASHELRTPIAAIKIAFETLREVYAEDPTQAERCMTVIAGHLGRLEEMLRDLLDMAKVESPTLKPHVRRLRTHDVFAHIRSSLSTMARQKLVELRLGCPSAGDESADAALASFLGDERLLNLVLKNLVENSIKFTPPGGSVTLRIREQRPGEAIPGRLVGEPAPAASSPSDEAIPTPAPTAAPAGPPVLISVTDTGIGIPAEHLDRVFERFYQVDPARSGTAGRGTGLGLAIVKHAVAAMNGSVFIASRVGEGTTVTCVLPQSQSPADPDDADVETESSLA